jgi:hypothetical protein
MESLGIRTLCATIRVVWKGVPVPVQNAFF